ncbi:MAG: SMI1/KNR4 family protein [Coriobacteriales bacterium]|nr:SMI1/KNR4 family protein [Coriobacteriales bacterium]
MNNLTSIMKELPDFYALNAAKPESIEAAERRLDVVFSDEYRSYIKEYGVVSVNGHELTGICSHSRLNVVDVTLQERSLNPLVPQQYYVIENSCMDGIIVWQDQTGTVYQTAPNSEPIKLCDSLLDYIRQ